jgi:hypothetical protein
MNKNLARDRTNYAGFDHPCRNSWLGVGAVSAWGCFGMEHNPLLMFPYQPDWGGFADVHDFCFRNHWRMRAREPVGDVEVHLHVNSAWKHSLSQLCSEPGVPGALE